jgi:hypothetical protein
MDNADNSVQIFYDELFDKLMKDTCENSYAEFNYMYDKKTELYNNINKYKKSSDSTEIPFYNDFITKYALLNINIKEIDVISCLQLTEPLPTINGRTARGCRNIEKYFVKFIVKFMKPSYNI